MNIYDYDTADKLTAEDLGITDDEYAEAIDESVNNADNASGVIRIGGRRVYAA